jgi:hypothetical protein
VSNECVGNYVLVVNLVKLLKNSMQIIKEKPHAALGRKGKKTD